MDMRRRMHTGSAVTYDAILDAEAELVLGVWPFDPYLDHWRRVDSGQLHCRQVTHVLKQTDSYGSLYR